MSQDLLKTPRSSTVTLTHGFWTPKPAESGPPNVREQLGDSNS